MGDDTVRQSDAFASLTAKHQDFLSKYRAMDWDGAEALLAECEKLGGDKLKGLYRLYLERIEAFRITPPPDNWDGTTQATSK